MKTSRVNKEWNKRKESAQDTMQEMVSKEDTELLVFLYQQFPNKRKKVKAVLEAGQVSVNGVATTKFNSPVKPGDAVRIQWTPVVADGIEKAGIRIIYEDQTLLVIDKPAGLLSVGTAKEKEKSVHRLMNQYIKNKGPDERIFVVHRLDRDTSGVMVMARDQKIRDQMQEGWDDIVNERIYYGIVSGKPVEEKGCIESYLFEDSRKIVRSTKNPLSGKKAITCFEVVKSGPKYSLLTFHLKTGRKNQIRVHMQDLDIPIVGDKKYGSTCNPLGRLGLHAYQLTLKHPLTGENMSFKSETPADFFRTVKLK